jgi:hypothetical protein
MKEQKKMEEDMSEMGSSILQAKNYVKLNWKVYKDSISIYVNDWLC